MEILIIYCNTKFQGFVVIYVFATNDVYTNDADTIHGNYTAFYLGYITMITVQNQNIFICNGFTIFV